MSTGPPQHTHTQTNIHTHTHTHPRGGPLEKKLQGPWDTYLSGGEPLETFFSQPPTPRGTPRNQVQAIAHPGHHPGQSPPPPPHARRAIEGGTHGQFFPGPPVHLPFGGGGEAGKRYRPGPTKQAPTRSASPTRAPPSCMPCSIGGDPWEKFCRAPWTHTIRGEDLLQNFWRRALPQ